MAKEDNWFKRHKFLTVLLMFVGVVIIVSAANGDTGTDEANNADTAQSGANKSKSATAKIGEPARDGKFEFTVTALKCGEKTLGNNEFTRTTAQGEFCVIDITVKNIGDEPQTLFADNQYVFNEENQKYSYSSQAWLALDEITDVFLNEINPGNTVRGKIPFDVPRGTEIVKAELHDSAFSSGIEVSLK